MSGGWATPTAPPTSPSPHRPSGGTELFVADGPNDPDWQAGGTYALDDRRVYAGIVYRCIQAHTNHDPGHTPNLTPALWTAARADGDPWVQPAHAGDAYGIGRVVLHGGTLYRSKIHANTTVPGSDDRWWEVIPDVVGAVRDLGAAIEDRDPLDRWSIEGY